ncbi:MAG: twin-arginine translocase subunit TatC [Gammaproteobacteria bacterium]|nr:twin-arginine translocase subunit TatC [Gammaproteobacteria bacterium]
MAAPDSQPGSSETEQPFLAHLMELRDRLLRMIVAVVIVTCVLLPFANPLFSLLAGPLMRHMPENSSMIATAVASPFLIPMKLALILAIFVCVPYLLYQIWGFIAPGLYRHEKRMALPLLVSSTLLFYLGVLFAYFVVFPLIFAFLTTTAPEGVQVMTDISNYLDFVLTLTLAFGAAFEVPVATFVLVLLGMTTPEALVEKRPYVIVGAFIIGAILTPPDAVTQTLLAVPMWLLFELGVLMARLFVKRKDEAEMETTGGATAEDELDTELGRIEEQERGRD